MKYLFFSTENLIGPVAEKLTQEGQEVTIAQIPDLRMVNLPEEGPGKAEDPECRKRRLSMGEGIVEQQDAVAIMKVLGKLNPKDFFVAGELNSSWDFCQRCYDKGFTGMLPLQEDRELEVARDRAKEIVKKNYPDLSVMECQEFKKAADGIKFLQESDQVWVLKSLGDSGETVCPKIDDPELANQEIIDMLEENAKAYEENGFMLEQKILNGIEMTPEAVFWNGKLVFTDLDIETKTIGGAELGPNVGCGTNLIVRTDPEDRINKIAFPPYVRELAAKRKGMFIIDCGIIFDRRTDKPYFTEFCFQRFGWDCFPTELMMCESTRDYFEKVVKGENPLKFRFGASTRLFNLNQDEDHQPEAGLSVDANEAAKHCLFLYDVKKDGDKIVTTGYQRDLGVACGSGDTVMEAVYNCYEYARGVAFNDLYYRSEDDFQSKRYSQAILRRLEYAVRHGLIKNEGILQDLGEHHYDSPVDMLEDFNRKYRQTMVDNAELQAKLKGYREQAKGMEDFHRRSKEKLKQTHAQEISKVKSVVKDLLEE